MFQRIWLEVNKTLEEQVTAAGFWIINKRSTIFHLDGEIK
jgi:hypothetical protein